MAAQVGDQIYIATSNMIIYLNLKWGLLNTKALLIEMLVLYLGIITISFERVNMFSAGPIYERLDIYGPVSSQCETLMRLYEFNEA